MRYLHLPTLRSKALAKLAEAATTINEAIEAIQNMPKQDRNPSITEAAPSNSDRDASARNSQAPKTKSIDEIAEEVMRRMQGRTFSAEQKDLEAGLSSMTIKDLEGRLEETRKELIETDRLLNVERDENRRLRNMISGN